MVVTDMRSAYGWSSNRGMVLLKSTDLIHWQHSAINFPTRYTKAWKNVIRVWAPETIYDHKAGKYMVFYSLRTSNPGSFDKIYYQYANKDFTDLEGEPKWLFDAGNATIDGDIVYNEADQMYHLFYKQESGRGIYQAVAKQLTDRWQMLDGNVEQTKEAVEGVGVCKAIDGKSWIIMYDCYGSGHYQFCKSEDLKTFEFIQNTETKGKFTPRHGTVIAITPEERDRLETWSRLMVATRDLKQRSVPTLTLDQLKGRKAMLQDLQSVLDGPVDIKAYKAAEARLKAFYSK
jgi:hypothetical protein